MQEKHTLGILYPHLEIHRIRSHFDFTRGNRRIMVTGPMGAGKTEYATRVWQDAEVILSKRNVASTGNEQVDRREVFCVASYFGQYRFPDAPSDALCYRSGFVQCGDKIATANNSFEIEELLQKHQNIGTWIIDETNFYDERLTYIIEEIAQKNRELVFIFPTLLRNFRRNLFNQTASRLLKICTDLFPLSAYCAHPHCISDAMYTYRYYVIDSQECPAPYFDPLIMVDPPSKIQTHSDPHYRASCLTHHLLPGEEYTFLVLKPLGIEAHHGRIEPLIEEMRCLSTALPQSLFYKDLSARYVNHSLENEYLRTLEIPYLAERALLFLYAENNLLQKEQIVRIIDTLHLNYEYVAHHATAHNRPIE